jgi:hypothetical protein
VILIVFSFLPAFDKDSWEYKCSKYIKRQPRPKGSNCPEYDDVTKNGDKSPYKNIFVIILIYYHVSVFCQRLSRSMRVFAKEKAPTRELFRG